jgi:hypothetical protein
METKSERITILTTPEFKARLEREARMQQISVAKLIRDRLERDEPASVSTADDAVLAALIEEVHSATRRAQLALDKGLAEAEATLRALRQ